jgi:hypothetical protein
LYGVPVVKELWLSTDDVSRDENVQNTTDKQHFLPQNNRFGILKNVRYLCPVAVGYGMSWLKFFLAIW